MASIEYCVPYICVCVNWLFGRHKATAVVGLSIVRRIKWGQLDFSLARPVPP